MPNGIAVTRMIPRNSKPENTWPIAGNGTEKPKFANASPTPLTLNPPMPRPNRFDPQAMSMPAAIATRPAGIPLRYFTPPNQLTRMMAKQISPICGVMYITPQIGLICFAIILVSWFGGVKYLKGIPAGLVAIAAGMLIAWGSNLFGLGIGGLSLGSVGDAVSHFGFSIPLPAVNHVFSGFEYLGVILVTAIPFGIYDLVEAMDNVESAEAAGDEYPTTRVLTADGIVSLIGCMMGNPFINAVYIGHPGWKAMGGRIGYSAATGVMVIVLSWLGIISVLLALVPVVAISPILLYIGMLIAAQAFQTTPVKHAPAIALALTPHLAAWAKLQIDTMLASTMTAAATVGGMAADKADAVKTAAIAALPQQGVFYHGLEVMGGGSILAGLILGAIGVFIIERDFEKASAFALVGAVLTYFGFMHGEAVGIGGGLGVTPAVALSYAAVAAGLFALGRLGSSEHYVSHPEMAAAPAE